MKVRLLCQSCILLILLILSGCTSEKIEKQELAYSTTTTDLTMEAVSSFPLSPCKNPSDFTMLNDVFYICDALEGNVEMFSRDGSYIGSLAGYQAFLSPEAITVTDESELAILDRGNHKIFVCNEQEKILNEYPLPLKPGKIFEFSSIVSMDNDFYVATKSYSKNGLYRVKADGSYDIVLKDVIGFVSRVDDTLYMTNDFIVDNSKDSQNLSSGISEITVILDKETKTYTMDNRLMPIDVARYNDTLLMSCFGNRGVNTLNLDSGNIKKVFAMADDGDFESFLWHFFVDEANDKLYCLDQGKMIMVEVGIHE